MWRPALVYLLLSLVVTWPLVLSPQSAYLGFANIDALDTLVAMGREGAQATLDLATDAPSPLLRQSACTALARLDLRLPIADHAVRFKPRC